MHSCVNPENDFNDHCEINLGKLQHDFNLKLNVNIQLTFTKENGMVVNCIFKGGEGAGQKAQSTPCTYFFSLKKLHKS